MLLAPCVGVADGYFSAHRSSKSGPARVATEDLYGLKNYSNLQLLITPVGLYTHTHTHMLTKGTKKMAWLGNIIEEHIKLLPKLINWCPFSHPNGEGGSPFDAGTCPEGVDGVAILSGMYIGGIQILFRDGNESPMFGSSWIDGSRHEFNVAEGDFIVKVEIWSGYGTDAVRFTTNCGMTSPKFGGDGGELRVY